MTRIFSLTTILLLSFASSGYAGGRWSRQLTAESLGDWVPLEPVADPSKRQASARVLNQPAPFQSSFFPAESSPNDYIPQESPRQLFVQSIPAGQQMYQNQPMVQLTLADPQYNPLAQAFVSQPINGIPYNTNLQFAQMHQAQLPSQIVQNPINLNNQFYSSIQSSSNLPSGPQQQTQKAQKPDVPRYVDGYRLENSSVDYFQNKKKPTSSSLKNKQEQAYKPQQRVTERSSTTNSLPTTPTVTTVEKEEVQLLYVPLETLQSEKFNAKQYFKTSQQQEAIRDSIGSPGQINNQLYTPTTPNYSQRQQSQLQNIQQELIQQAYNAQTLQGKFKQNQYDRQPKYQQTLSTISFPFTQSVYPTPVITTPKSKKLKAHQPPLAIFMYQKPNDKAKLTDVLSTLKGAKAISVLDNIGPNSPKVFIGPSTLKIPDYYTKFDLPYLSSVDGNRIQRKVDQLPFFVAPLSYKAPDGFAKIPFPAPHVGSVIINPFMSDFQSPRPTPIADAFPSSYSFSTFQQNPSTESFRSTLNEQTTLKQNPFNYFPSATPNPIISPQSTVSSFHSSFLPYEPQTFNSFRPMPSAKQPESNVVNSSRQPPLASYFSSTPSKPTVSYFSFASPEYTTPTTNKPSTTQNYQYRGHYITNSAVDNNSGKTKTSLKESNREIYRTTPLPSFAPTLPPHNAYSINNAFQPTGSQDAGEIKNPEVNEVREYSTEPSTEKVVSYSQYNNAQNSAVNENSQYSAFNDYSPVSYYGQSISDKPNEYESQTESSSPLNDNRDYSPLQYQNPSANDDAANYQTEYQHNEITTTSTTTTTTTTTVAPTTKATRRPIHLRGRPRYTTQKPDNADHATRATTRRTPIRERKPNNYRSRQETSKAPATEATTATETSNFESAKRGKVSETTESAKINRYSGYRNRPADEETKTTTESSLPKTSAANRNQRLRSRGKTHFKISDNYEGSDYAVKKTKKTGEGESIAYQRDVLHQNYPVTLTERMSTIEVHTTPIPSNQGIDLTNGKIRIYETTGSTQKSYPAQDSKSSESLLEYYDNQPVFQAESQKYLTQPESYIEVSSERSASTGAPEIYITAKESSTERVEPSSSVRYEPEISSNIEEQRNAELYDAVTRIENEKLSENQEIQSNAEDVSEKIPESVFETPIARFRSKLRSRPKALASTSLQKENIENDYETKHVNSVAINKKPIEESDNTFSITRRSSLQPVTYRPAFDRRRTTMRIEEIEAELKSSRRQQSRQNLHSSTLKYPVYVPESSSRNPNVDVENVESTTKRNHFVRRRPVKPTAASVSSTSRPRAAAVAEQSSSEQSVTPNKRVRVRSRLRTRPSTTERIEEIKQEDSTESQIINDDKYSRSTERTPSQKYTTRGRLATQKYLKKSSPATERNIQVSKEVEDQASYDSINRPEYVEYNPIKADLNEYNPENGKAESHWSPKLSYNSFKPIFNPNFIADDIKPDGIEYGTKLPQTEFDDEDSEIITAGNPFEDMLISVTPASNKLNGETSNKKFGKSFYDNKNDDEEIVKKTAPSLSFESVLEEVMKNLEEQDENEYETEYNKSVMKHESGEIGEIPPETEIPAHHHNNFEIKKIDENLQSKSNAAIEEVSFENKVTTSTERQPRRRGVWRRVKVRPVHKDMLEGAESQFYTNSNNDLVKNEEKSKGSIKLIEKTEKIKDETRNVEEFPKNHKPEEIPKNHKPEVISEIENLEEIPKNHKPEVISEIQKSEEIPKNHKPEEIPKNHKSEETQEATTIISDADAVTDISPGDMDLGIGSPEAMMIKMHEKITEDDEIKAILEIEQEIEKKLEEKITPEVDSQEVIEDKKETDNLDEEVIENKSRITEDKIKDTQNSNKSEINYTQRSVVTLISKEHTASPTTTETPLAIPMEFEAEQQTETTIAPNEESDDTISSQNTEAPKDLEENTTNSEIITTKPETDVVQKETVTKIESVESTTSGLNYWDPKNIISTSMSTEISHETEICYRGRCIKTKKENHKK